MADPMSADLLGRDAVALTLDGLPAPPALANAVTLILLRQALGVPAALEIDIADPDGAAVVGLKPGIKIAVRIGERPLFEGQVAAAAMQHDAAGGLIVRLRAYDALQAARQNRRLRAIQNASAATIGEQMAGDLGLGFACQTDAPKRALILQHGESDLALLAGLAAEAGLYPVVLDGKLTLVALDGIGDELLLKLGRSLYSVDVTASNEAALRRVEVHGWNAATLSEFRETATTARQDAFDMQDLKLADDSGGFTLNRVIDSAAAATALAQARLDRAAATEVIARGVCPGDPALTPGRPLRITGTAVDPGRLVATEAVHRIDAATGYTTEFSTAPPWVAERHLGPVITHGAVADIDDPDGLGRCRVTLPSFGGLATGWMQVLVPGAGKGKGLAVLPELADGVLVVLPDGDPAQGCILGGLYGEQRLPRGSAVRRDRPFVLRTAGGQGLELGRDSAIARLSTSGGSVVELTPKQMRLAAASDLLIEAPGKTITIRADAIHFEQG